MFRRVIDLALTLLAFQCLIKVPLVAAADPKPPKLSYLYTSIVECDGFLMTEEGPHGTRRAIPIVGGTFTGPRLSGKIMNLGADWALTDPKTKIVTSDTRYQLRTDDGADIYVQTSGPMSPTGELHLRLVFETGHKDYYWMNNIVAIGTLKALEFNSQGSKLQIDVWNFASDWNTTLFLG